MKIRFNTTMSQLNSLLKSKPGGLRAGGIVIHEGKILLMHVKRYTNPPEEFYILPGGHQEKNEYLEDTCVREIEEEFGITVNVKELEMVVIGTSRVAFYFSCEYTEGDIVLGGPEKELHDSDEPEKIYVEWVDLKEVPNLPIGPEVTKNALISYLREKDIISPS